jgi:integrase
MASVFKRPRSKFWHAGWRGTDGKFQLRSTKQIDRTKALTIALEWERVDKKIGKGEVVENQIRQVINDLLEKVGESTCDVPTIRQWFTDWQAEKEASRSEKTAERYKSVVDEFLAHLGNRADKLLTVLMPRDIQGYVAKRQKEGLSSTTVNLDAKILRTALNRARRQGVIQTNPAEAVDLPERRSVERGTFTPAEIKMLLDECRGTEWETLILFGYYTSARLGDSTKMLWDKMNLTDGTMEFFEGKNQKWITLPMHPELQRHLLKLAGIDKPQKHITPKMAELGPGGRHGLSEGFKRIVVKAGLDLQTVEGSGVRNISKRTFHALRHSFTSALANAGVAPELRMKLTGHKSAAVHKGYTHLELETLRKAIGKLPSLPE